MQLKQPNNSIKYTNIEPQSPILSSSGLSNSSSSLENAIKKVQKELFERKNLSESYLVGCFWQNPELLLDYENIGLGDFRINKWRVFFQIVKGMKDEKYEHIDEMETNLYLEKHPKLKSVYESAGGWKTIRLLSSEYINSENIESYHMNNIKWESLCRKIEKGYFITEEQLAKFTDMTYDEIYDYFDYENNDIFHQVGSKLKGFDLSDEIDDTVNKLFSNDLVGLPYYNMPILTKLTNGSPLGELTGLGAPTGVGKSTILRNVHVTSIINSGEQIVIYINEESRRKWQIEYMAWAINTIFKKDIQKSKLKKGSSLTKEEKDLILKSAEWIKTMKNSHVVTIVPVDIFNVKEVIRSVKKYVSNGVKYFAIDTFKEEGNSYSDNEWEVMARNMRMIYDVIKPENKNVHMFVTVQLKQSDVRQRFLTQDNTGRSKAMANVMGIYLMARKMFEDEKPLPKVAEIATSVPVADEKTSSDYKRNKNELDVKNIVDGKHIVPVKIDPMKDYLIVFIVKNREGESEKRQVVIEADFARNIFKEVGYTQVPFS